MNQWLWPGLKLLMLFLYMVFYKELVYAYFLILQSASPVKYLYLTNRPILTRKQLVYKKYSTRAQKSQKDLNRNL